MRIALFHNLPSGGAKRALYEWTRRLSNEHTIDVYSLKTADHAFCDIRPLVAQQYLFNFSPHRLFKSPFGRLNAFQRLRDLSDLDCLHREMAKKINAGKYDVIFAHTCLYTFIPALLQYTDIPAIYYLHEPFGPSFIRPVERPYLYKNRWRNVFDHVDPLISLYRRRLDSIQRRSIQRTNHLLSNSRFTSECIKVAFRVDAEICPIGVDVEAFYPLPDIKRENFVLSVGELSPRKGFDFIIESLGQIPAERRPSLKLACNVIQGNELGFIKDLAESYDVDLQVFTRLDTTQLLLLYNRALLCVYAPVMEPFGLVPLEAMACATPVISVREGGVQESVVHEHTGLLTDRDPDQFAKAIEFLMKNSQLARIYGCNGRDHVTRNWTWEKSTEILNTHLAEYSNLAG